MEFAKSVRTLADLDCAVLLEIGPQPVLTATALRAWPDPATTPRAIASLRPPNTADHRQITEALADAYIAGHLPDFTEFGQAHARMLDLPTYPFERRQYWYLDNRELPNQQQHLGGPRTEAVRLLEDGHLEELATLLDGASVDDQTMRVLTKLAAQHNQQRTSPNPSPTIATNSAGRNPLRPSTEHRSASRPAGSVDEDPAGRLADLCSVDGRSGFLPAEFVAIVGDGLACALLIVLSRSLSARASSGR